VRDYGRWRLTTAQRLLIIVAAVAALFLSAMALGSQNLSVLLVAVLVLVLTGFGVFLLGLRAAGRATVQGSAHVLAAQPPPLGLIIGKCDMRLLLDLPDAASIMVRLRDPAVPVIKWPWVGAVLPVEVATRNPRNLRVRWDQVSAHHGRPPVGVPPVGVEPAAGYSAPLHTEYADGAFETDYGPGTVTVVDHEGPTFSTAVIDVEVTDGPLVPTPPGSDTLVDTGPLVPPDDGAVADGLAADGAVPTAADASAGPDTVLDPDALVDPDAPVEPDALAEPDDVVDRPAPTAGPLMASGAGPVVGRARAPRTEPPPPDPGPGAVPRPRGSEPAGDTEPAGAAGMGIMLIVSNLDRSLDFYRDRVGARVVDRSPGAALLAYGAGRILLRQVTDMSPVDRRVVHVHIQVPDVVAAHQALRDRGVEFVHRPRVTSRGDRVELWAATFRDPDGHSIALTQWRDRDAATTYG
jgi:resuscitation-promoting factor RpfA